MPRFFIDNAAGDTLSITGGDASHIARSLRMREGERLTVTDGSGSDCICEICSVTPDEVLLNVIERTPCLSEPSVRVTLYQGYPKGDKLELVIEKAVELGAKEIVPVLTERSVARPDSKSADKKRERWQRHALEAAKQCGRGIIPQVLPLTPFSRLEEMLSRHDLCVFCYELGGSPLSALIKESNPRDIGIFIGPEGGISDDEAEKLTQMGAHAATLGARILRTETAGMAAIAAVMTLTGNMD